MSHALVLLLALAAAPAAIPPAAPATPAPAQVSSDPRVVQALKLLEAWLESERDYKRLPSISMAVVHDPQLLWSHAYGEASLERKAAAW